MPKFDIAVCRPAAGILAVLTLASVGLTACGGSSGKTSSATNASASPNKGYPTSGGTPGGGSSTTGSTTGNSGKGSSTSGSSGSSRPGGSSQGSNPRIAAVRECMQRNGVTLPKPANGSGNGILLGASAKLPKGVTRAEYTAALRKCLGGRPVGSKVGATGANSRGFRLALAKFATCMRQNGINVPLPNPSGKGPIFNTKGIKTNTPQFRAATLKCRATLVNAFRRPGSASGGAVTKPAGK